jgi:putative addiction module component (TIGR02574 family)
LFPLFLQVNQYYIANDRILTRAIAMPSAADFEHLPVAEKLRLVTQLWEQIVNSGESVALPNSVIFEGERRLDEMLADPSLGISAEEMWRQADAKRK